MSEKNNKRNLNSIETLTKLLATVLILFSAVTALSLLLTLVLRLTSTPETFYGFSGYVVLAIASYLTGKLYVKNADGDKLTVIILSTVISTVIISVITLAINNGSTALLPIIIKAVIIFLFMSLSLKPKNKRKKRSVKRR